MVDPPGQRSIDKADLMSASGQFSWPPAGRFVAVYGQDLMAADKCDLIGRDDQIRRLASPLVAPTSVIASAISPSPVPAGRDDTFLGGFGDVLVAFLSVVYRSQGVS